MAYASAFEQTLVDDDWTRLRPFFAADAVYEVQSRDFGCRLVGPDAIFAGMKKSLNGFDRRFETRNVAVTSSPVVDGDEMRVGWTVTYGKAGVAPLPLRGRSTVRYRDGVIAQLTDAFDPDMERELADWQRAKPCRWTCRTRDPAPLRRRGDLAREDHRRLGAFARDGGEVGIARQRAGDGGEPVLAAVDLRPLGQPKAESGLLARHRLRAAARRRRRDRRRCGTSVASESPRTNSSSSAASGPRERRPNRCGRRRAGSRRRSPTASGSAAGARRPASRADRGSRAPPAPRCRRRSRSAES